MNMSFAECCVNVLFALRDDTEKNTGCKLFQADVLHYSVTSQWDKNFKMRQLNVS